MPPRTLLARALRGLFPALCREIEHQERASQAVALVAPPTPRLDVTFWAGGVGGGGVASNLSGPVGGVAPMGEAHASSHEAGVPSRFCP